MLQCERIMQTNISIARNNLPKHSIKYTASHNNIFSLFVSPHPGEGVTPFPSHNTSTGPISFLGYPSDWSQVPSQWGTTSCPSQGVSHPYLAGGTAVLARGYPKIGYLITFCMSTVLLEFKPFKFLNSLFSGKIRAEGGIFFFTSSPSFTPLLQDILLRKTLVQLK